MKRAFLLFCLLTPLAAAAAPGFTMGKSVALGAPDRWDYVVLDPAGARAYVAHGDRVTAVDTASGTVAGTLPVGGATHGILVLPGLDKGYADDGKAGLVWVFDPRTLKLLHSIKAEPDADGMGEAEPSGGGEAGPSGDGEAGPSGNGTASPGGDRDASAAPALPPAEPALPPDTAPLADDGEVEPMSFDDGGGTP